MLNTNSQIKNIILLQKYFIRIARYQLATLKHINQETLYKSLNFSSKCYKFDKKITPSRSNDFIAEQKLTSFIDLAGSVEQLKSTFNQYINQTNYIHLTAFLQKVTKRPFQNDSQFVQKVIQQIKSKWYKFYQYPDENNSRAIANTICYMSRKVKRHHLDEQFIKIDYFKLIHYLNPKQFVMTITGLLKLNLIQKIFTDSNDLEKLILQVTDKQVHPGLLVSLWFNILKFQKSTQSLNDHFAQLLKTKHFKNNLIDYTQMVYCYVNSINQRTVDCKYPIMTYPTQNKSKFTIGAHELSLLFQQLARLKKITDVYLSESFTQFIYQCYVTVLNQKDIPLRNVANVFNSIVLFEEPSEFIVKQTFSRYYGILKNQISNIERYTIKNMKKFDVDQISYVSLFHQLMSSNQPPQNYKSLATISIRYLEKILSQHKVIDQYSDRSFLRILASLQLSKSKINKHFNQTLILADSLKQKLQDQIIKRKIQQKSLGKLMASVTYLQIKSQKICKKFKKTIENMQKSQNKWEDQGQINYSQRLKQSCILSKQGINCLKCFE